MIRFLTILVTIFWTQLSLAAPTPLVYVDGVITPSSVAPIAKYLDKLVESGSDADVDVLINSPGGSVTAGMSLVNKMAALRVNGSVISCYVTDMAASMAFQLLTQCDKRVALPTSFLLWHGVRTSVSGPITSASARMLSDDIAHMDALVLMQLDDSLGLDSTVIRQHFAEETLWSGLTLHVEDPEFLVLMDAFPEILQRIPTSVRSEEKSFFNLFGGSTGTEIGPMEYIWSGYQQPSN